MTKEDAMSRTQRGSTARPTIYDVAQRAGVSKSLVSLVLQNSPRVSQRRREAVLGAISELGYRPSTAAASLGGSRTRSIGVAIDDFENPWFVDLLRGIRRVLDVSGLNVSVADRHLNAHLGLDPVEAFLSMRVEALVLAMETEETTGDLGGLPVVVAGNRTRVPDGADLVSNDDTEGGRLATMHLLGLGHTAVGHLTGGGGAAALRRAAYEDTMAGAGLAPRVVGQHLGGQDSGSQGSGTTEEDGYVAAGALLDSHPDTTAVFAANDVMLLGAMAALRERGLSTPDDVSLIGYDNSPLAGARYLGFTTVDDRSVDVGIHVAQTILDRRTDGMHEPRRTLLPPRLVPRSSTAPPRR
jgi:DNA-binding LacI/PurR family transcriptional regulator